MTDKTAVLKRVGVAAREFAVKPGQVGRARNRLCVVDQTEQTLWLDFDTYAQAQGHADLLKGRAVICALLEDKQALRVMACGLWRSIHPHRDLCHAALLPGDLETHELHVRAALTALLEEGE